MRTKRCSYFFFLIFIFKQMHVCEHECARTYFFVLCMSVCCCVFLCDCVRSKRCYYLFFLFSFSCLLFFFFKRIKQKQAQTNQLLEALSMLDRLEKNVRDANTEVADVVTSERSRKCLFTLNACTPHAPTHVFIACTYIHLHTPYTYTHSYTCVSLIVPRRTRIRRLLM